MDRTAAWTFHTVRPAHCNGKFQGGVGVGKMSRSFFKRLWKLVCIFHEFNIAESLCCVKYIITQICARTRSRRASASCSDAGHAGNTTRQFHRLCRLAERAHTLPQTRRQGSRTNGHPDQHSNRNWGDTPLATFRLGAAEPCRASVRNDTGRGFFDRGCADLRFSCRRSFQVEF